MSSGKTVLVVDDDEALRELIALFVQKRGHRTLTAANGQEALRQLQDGTPVDLIVMDVMMPVMSGFEALDQLRASGIMTPIIMLTALDRDESVMEGYEAGADYYLTKPFKTAALLNIVDYLIGDLSPEERAKLESLI